MKRKRQGILGSGYDLECKERSKKRTEKSENPKWKCSKRWKEGKTGMYHL